MKKLIIALCISLMSFQCLVSTDNLKIVNAQANAFKCQDLIRVQYNRDGFVNPIDYKAIDSVLAYDDNSRAASSIVVFFGGIIIGYVIDGVFIYSTGHSVGELVESAIVKIEQFVNRNNPNYLASVTTNGTNVIGYSTLGGQECYRANPNVNWVCNYSL